MIAGLIGAAPAQADSASEARAHYDRATRFYEDGSYDAALVELNRAYELDPSFQLLYNMAQVQLAMRDYAAAIESLQRYLREGGGQVSNARVSAVRSQLDDLQQRIGKLTIETDVNDADVWVDDVSVGTAPLPSPVLVNAGVRRVSVRHRDYPAQTQRVAVGGGEQLRVSLPLRQPGVGPRASERTGTEVRPSPQPPPGFAETEPAAVPAAPTPPPAPLIAPPGEASTNHTLPIVTTAVTGALVATAIALAVVSENKDSDLASRRNQPGQDKSQFESDRLQLRTFAALTDVFLITSLAGAGLSVWFWLRSSDERLDAVRAEELQLRVSLGGARLLGRF